MAKTALLIGSTGLIGAQLLDLLLGSEQYDQVVAISRKPLGINHGKLKVVVCELKELEQHSTHLIADDVFCCLGTTIKKAKTKEAFRVVDHDAPIALARIALENGAKQYLLVSALGANKNSSIFYNRVKGEVEDQIGKLGFSAFHIFRPSLLTGNRQEHRSGEEAAQIFYKIFGWLIPAKYKAIDSAKVARAMLQVASNPASGTVIYESNELQSY